MGASLGPQEMVIFQEIPLSLLKMKFHAQVHRFSSPVGDIVIETLPFHTEELA